MICVAQTHPKEQITVEQTEIKQVPNGLFMVNGDTIRMVEYLEELPKNSINDQIILREKVMKALDEGIKPD
tara:strand:- start:1 stop:213 length:213 start_codon:yes stop_codon:yes gene_type:complete